MSDGTIICNYKPNSHTSQRKYVMPKVSDMITSKYLRKEDFEDEAICTIKGVRLEDLGKDEAKEERWILYFREQSKGMVLNVTTIRVLEQALGGDTDQWIGNKVIVYVDPNVSFGGKVVGGLRLRIHKEKIAKELAKQPSRSQTANFEEDGEVPF